MIFPDTVIKLWLLNFIASKSIQSISVELTAATYFKCWLNVSGDKSSRDWDKAWSKFKNQGGKKAFSKFSDKYVSWNPRRSEFPLSEEVDPIKRTERSNLEFWNSPTFTLGGAIIIVTFLLLYTILAPIKWSLSKQCNCRNEVLFLRKCKSFSNEVDGFSLFFSSFVASPTWNNFLPPICRWLFMPNLFSDGFPACWSEVWIWNKMITLCACLNPFLARESSWKVKTR